MKKSIQYPIENDREGSPCETVWDWIDDHEFETKREAIDYAKKTDANDHVFDCIENYPWEPSFDEQVKELRERGLSRNKISQQLHASHDRVQRSLDSQKISGKFAKVVQGVLKFFKELGQ